VDHRLPFPPALQQFSYSSFLFCRPLYLLHPCPFLPFLPCAPRALWNAHKFDPERFNEERKEDLVYRRNWLLFGAGPHQVSPFLTRCPKKY